MMRKIELFAAALVLSVATQAGAQILYSQDFETNPGYTAVVGDDSAIGAAGSAKPYVAFGEWAGTATIPITQTDGALQVGSDTAGGGARTRCLEVFVDTSTWVAGIHTVQFDVSNWVDGTGSVGMSVFEGSGLETLYVQVDNGGNSAAGNWPRLGGTVTDDTIIGDTGSGSFWTGITSNGTYRIDVALTKAGVAGNFMMLGWTQVRTTGTEMAPTFDIDNVLVEVFSGPNLPPVADDKSADVVQNEFVDITLTGSDPEGSNLTYFVESDPTNGVLTGATNVWTYTPNTDYAGPDSFTFTVNDGETNSEPATVSISVNLNEQPVADAQRIAVEKNTDIEITLTASDLETANSNLTYNVGTPTYGDLSIVSNQTYIYTPNTDYAGPDSFTFTVNDGKTNSEPATISIKVFEQPVVGTILYEEDFDLNPGYTGSGDHAVGAAGSAKPYHVFGEWGGTPDIGITQDGGVLHIDSNTSGSSARNRGFTVTIDTSAAGPGTYTVSFDVSNWVDGNGSAGMAAHDGSGLDTLYAEWDVGGNSSEDAWPSNKGTAPSTLIGDTGSLGTGISSNGTYRIDVDLTMAGVAGDYMTLAFAQIRTLGTALAPTFDVDNVVVGVGTGGGGPQTDPVITDISVSGSDVTLTWTADYNGTYSIQRKTSLQEAIWTDVLTGLLGGGGTTNVPAGGTNAEFYQIYGE